MVSLGDVKRSAAVLFGQGQCLPALRLYDAIVSAAPLDYDARIRVADCALALGDPSAAGEGANDANVGSYDPADEETVATIKELLESRVRPAVAQDGGDITFSGFRDGIVYLHMRGACAGCPSSTATLRHGIENLLKHFCPDVQSVQSV